MSAGVLGDLVVRLMLQNGDYVQQLKAAEQQATQTAQKIGQQFKSAESEGSKLAATLAKQEAMFGMNATAARRFEANMVEMTAAERQAVETHLRNIEVMERQKAQMDDVGKWAKRAGVALGAMAAAGVTAFVMLADKGTTLRNQMEMALGSQARAAQVQQQVYEMAMRTGTAYDALAGTYVAITRAVEPLGIAQGKVLRVVEAVNNAMALSPGASAGMQAGLVQLGQALSSGTLRGDELNSVLEQIPELAAAIAQGLGVTRGELRQMGADGKLTAEAVVNALDKVGPELAAKVASAQLTIGKAFTNLSSSALKAASDMDQAVGVTAKLAEAVNWAAQNLDKIGLVLGGGALAAGLAALVMYGGSLIAMLPGLVAGAVGLAAALGPVGLAAAGVMALVAALVVLDDKLAGSGTEAVSLSDLVGGAFDLMGSKATDAADQTAQANAKSAGDTVGAWETGLRKVAAGADWLHNVAIGTGAGIGAVFVATSEVVRNAFKSAFNAVAEAGEQTLNNLIDKYNAMPFTPGRFDRVSFSRATISGATSVGDIRAAASVAYDEAGTSYWSDMADSVISAGKARRTNRAIAGATAGNNANLEAQIAANRRLAESEKAMLDIRREQAGVSKEYEETLVKLQQALETGAISEAEYKDRVAQLAQETWDASNAGKAAAAAAKERAKGSDDAAKAAEREQKAYEGFMNSLRQRIAGYEQEAETGQKLTAADKARLELDKLVAAGKISLAHATSEQTKAMLEQLKAGEANAKWMSETRSENEKFIQTQQQRRDALEKEIRQQEEANAKIGMTARALSNLEVAKMRDTAASLERRAAVMRDIDLSGRMSEQLLEEAANWRKLATLKEDGFNTQAALDAQKQTDEDWKKRTDQWGQSLADALMNGGKSARDYLKGIFRNLVLRPLIEFAVSPITGLMGNLMGANTGGNWLSSLFGGGSNGSSLLSLGTNLFSGLQTGWAGMVGNAVGSVFGTTAGNAALATQLGMSAGEATAAASAASVAGGGTGAGAGLGANLGGLATGLGVVAMPLIVGAIIEKYGKHNWERFTGAATSANTAAPTVNAGSTSYDMLTGNLPDRSALISQLTGLGASEADLTGLNDRQLYKLLTNANTEMGTDREGGPRLAWSTWIKDNADLQNFYTGSGYANPEAMGWWANDQFYGSYGGAAGYNALGVDPAIVEAMRAVATSVADPMNAISKALGGAGGITATAGLASDADKGFWAGLAVKDAAGNSLVDFGRREGAGIEGTTYKSQDAALQATFGAALDGVTKQVSDAGIQWAQVQAQATKTQIEALTGDNVGQQAAALYQTSAASIAAAIAAFQQLINTVPVFAHSTQDAVHAISEASGGLDTFQQRLGSYFSNFYSGSERRQMALDALNQQFSDLGITAPKSAADFRRMTDAALAGGEATATLAAQLLAMNDTVAAVYQQIEVTFGNSDALTSLIASGMLGTFDGENLGASMAQTVMQGIYGALAGGFAQQITDIIVTGIVNPALQAAVTGSSVSAVVSDAAIADMVSKANVVADFATKLFNDPAFQSAMQRIGTAVAGISVPTLTMSSAFTTASVAQSSYTSAVESGTSALKSAKSAVDDIWSSLSSMFNDALSTAREAAATAKGVAQTAGDAKRALWGEASDTAAFSALQGNNFIDQAVAAAASAGVLPDQTELAQAINAARGGLDAADFTSSIDYEVQKAILAAKLGTLEDVAGTQQSVAEQQVSLLEQQVAYWQEQIDLLRNEGDSLASIDAGVSALAAALNAERAAAGLGAVSYSMPSFAVGTDYVPADMVAAIHQGEMVVPAAPAAIIRALAERAAGSGDAQVQAEARDLLKAIKLALEKLGDQFENVTAGGTAMLTEAV